MLSRALVCRMGGRKKSRVNRDSKSSRALYVKAQPKTVVYINFTVPVLKSTPHFLRPNLFFPYYQENVTLKL